MTETELKKLIAQGETLTVEFKRARGGVPADFWPSYSAFANTEGGVIVLGVRETNGKREVEGLADPENYIFSLVDIGERSGMGLSSLYGVWERQKYADPAIAQEYEPDRTKVVVEFESDVSEVIEKVTENESEVTEKVTENGVKVTEKVTENRSEDAEKVAENARGTSAVNATERAIIKLILEDSSITQGVLSEKLDLSRPYVARTMLELQTRGLIRRVGPDKGGHWEVL